MFERFFRKCGILSIVFPSVLVLICITGCIQSTVQEKQQVLQEKVEQTAESGPVLEVDFQSEVNKALFHTWGSLLLRADNTIPYLVLNATFQNQGLQMRSAKYLMLQIEPGKSYAFDISENRLVPPGSYRCLLEISGPSGTIFSETRGCRIGEDLSSETRSMIDSQAGNQAVQRSDIQRQNNEISIPASNDYTGDKPQTPVEVDIDHLDSKKNSGTARNDILSSKGSEISDKSKSDFSGNNQLSGNSQDNISDNDSGNNSDKRPSQGEVGGSKTGLASLTSQYQHESEEPIVKKESPEPSRIDAPNTMSSSSLQSADKKSYHNPQVELIGTKSTKKYHRPDCRYALKIKSDNKIIFSSSEEARENGYKPCKVCNPS